MSCTSAPVHAGGRAATTLPNPVVNVSSGSMSATAAPVPRSKRYLSPT
jgi:hypothetical protein